MGLNMPREDIKDELKPNVRISSVDSLNLIGIYTSKESRMIFSPQGMCHLAQGCR